MVVKLEEVRILYMSLFIVLFLIFLLIQTVASGSILHGSGALILSSICLPFVTPALRRICLPYVPATTTQVNNILKALEGRGGSLIDLGSGDGRIVVAAAKRGFVGTGVELNPWLVIYSKIAAFREGLSRDQARFRRQDIWKTDLSSYDNVVIFGVDSMMKELEVKFENEMKKDGVVIACRFPLPSRKHDSHIGEGIDTVWVYKSVRTDATG